MDPLSIIASIIAIAGAVSTSLDQLRSFVGAEADVLSLMNEVSDLQLILDQISLAIQDHGREIYPTVESIQAIGSVLNRSLAEVEALHQILNNVVLRVDPATGRYKVRKLAWLLHKSKLGRLNLKLKDTRVTLSTLCSAASLSNISKIQLRITGLTVCHDSIDSKLVEQIRLLETVLQRHDGPGSGAHVDIVEAVSPAEDAAVSLLHPAAVPNPDDSSAQSMDLKSNTFSSRTHGSIRISATNYRRSRCKLWCSCRCHQNQTLQTPRSARLLLGSLFVDYNGFPAFSQKCDESDCSRKSDPTLKVEYHFPSWLLNRMLFFMFSGSFVNGPQASLSMPRVVQDSSDVFVCAVRGDLDGMKSLFEQGIASPFDIGVGTGRSALHYAVNYNHAELAQFLIEVGADLRMADHEHATPVAIAWRRVFGRLADVKTAEAYQHMFMDEEFLESRVFQPLHQIVLGLSSGELEQQFKEAMTNIDAMDADGRTALSWAVMRGDFEAVETLLRLGADPNIPSLWGQIPLHFAVQNQTHTLMPIIRTLVEYGSEVNAIDHWNRTALTYASGNHPDVAPLQLLVKHGTPLDVRDRRLRTAIGYAARLGNFQHTKYLLETGADPNLPDEFNVLPLLEGIRNNYHDIVRLLIPVSHPLQIRPFSSSLLHWVAAYADSTTLEILRGSPLKNLFDPSWLTLLNAEGLTPRNVFDERLQMTTGEKEGFEGFEELMQDIRKNKNFL